MRALLDSLADKSGRRRGAGSCEYSVYEEVRLEEWTEEAAARTWVRACTACWRIRFRRPVTALVQACQRRYRGPFAVLRHTSFVARFRILATRPSLFLACIVLRRVVWPVTTVSGTKKASFGVRLATALSLAVSVSRVRFTASISYFTSPSHFFFLLELQA